MIRNIWSEKSKLLSPALVLALVAIFFPCAGADAQSTQTHYYWVAPLLSDAVQNPQSFVIAVDDSTAAQIEGIFNSGGQPGFGGKIAAGPVDYSKDYYSPDHHVWNWHVTAVLKIFDFKNTAFIECQCPYLIDNPSDIAADPDAWIQKNGDQYVPKNYQIIHEIQPGQKDAVANVSNRGLTGSGERTLISGFIVTGGEPRNVVVRALGPSLSSSGIQQFVTNPRLDVYQGSNVIGGNKDWKKDLRADELAQKYPSLVPSNDNEAAMLLTLLPGTYTLQGLSEDGTEGVMILEAYDVDSSIP
jgi:hypothetical protein